MVESIPGCQFASLIDQHWRLWSTVLSKLFVCWVWRHQGDLDRVEWVGCQNLCEKPGIDHRGFRSVRPHQVDRLRLVLLSLGCVLVNHLPDSEGVGDHAGHQALQAVQDLLVPRVWPAGEVPPILDMSGLLLQ